VQCTCLLLTQSGHFAEAPRPSNVQVWLSPHKSGAAMKRREFITLVGGVAAWPLAARAQQPERIRRIGSLTGVADDPIMQPRLAAFLQALQQLGWIDGDNVRIDYRGGGDADRIRKNAAELVALTPDVILATGISATEQLLKATRTVPIVFVIVPRSSWLRLRR
jgi:putative tryptophan/tyrosine transport system substrate-binding protein